jgi:hypothetical protein
MTKPWGVAAKDALMTGAAGAALSTVALAVLGKAETGSSVAPTNAISHWVWGDQAAAKNRPSLRHTAVGYTIHHCASVFWAAFYERWFGERKDRGEVGPALAGGLGVAALACLVDYTITPHRLRPGYEMRLSKRALAVVYVAFGVGLGVGSLFNAAAERRRVAGGSPYSSPGRTRSRASSPGSA